jgi:ribosome-associated protein
MRSVITTTPPDNAGTIGHNAPLTADEIVKLVQNSLDDGKAEDIVTIDLEGKSNVADFLVIASGRSDRQVVALADRVATDLQEAGFGRVSAEGTEHGDWVLIDAIDVIVHIFRPEVRSYYNLEKMWGALSTVG